MIHYHSGTEIVSVLNYHYGVHFHLTDTFLAIIKILPGCVGPLGNVGNERTEIPPSIPVNR